MREKRHCISLMLATYNDNGNNDYNLLDTITYINK